MAALLKLSFIFFIFLALAFHGESRMQDMTHVIREGHMARYLGHDPFKSTATFRGRFNEYVPWASINSISMGEHIGTHLDSPYHFVENGSKIADIPFSQLHGPAVVINITERALEDRNAEVLVSDLEEWEEKHGEIPDGSWILMNAGWNRYWPDQVAFTGANETGQPSFYPGFSENATKWLIENRDIVGLGVDTISCENGILTDTKLPVHQLISPLGILCAEVINNMEKIPEAGATFHILPINLYDGTGAPSRAYATWDDKEEKPTHKEKEKESCNGQEKLKYHVFSMQMALMSAVCLIL